MANISAGFTTTDALVYTSDASGNLVFKTNGTTTALTLSTTQAATFANSVSAAGNVTGNYILGNGSLLSGLSTSSISNGTSNVNVVSSGGNVTAGVNGTGNVAVVANTGVYISGVVSASGNITGGNLLGVTPPNVQIFTSGSGTYTTPTGSKYLMVEMVGGGSGGGASGTASTPGGVSGAGTATTFGSSLLTCNGGAACGGVGGAQGGGVGGSATINSPAVGIAISGSAGGGGLYQLTGIGDFPGGQGGPSALGGGGRGGSANGAGTAAPANSGGGGGGAGVGNSNTNQSGPGGGSGGYIKAFINSPLATYAYSVGSGGAGSTGGSIAQGGAGGSGIIIVVAYF